MSEKAVMKKLSDAHFERLNNIKDINSKEYQAALQEIKALRTQLLRIKIEKQMEERKNGKH